MQLLQQVSVAALLRVGSNHVSLSRPTEYYAIRISAHVSNFNATVMFGTSALSGSPLVISPLHAELVPQDHLYLHIATDEFKDVRA